MNIENSPLIEPAMQIILYAGDAREQAAEALKHAKQFEFTQAEICLHEANRLIIEAHHAQTDIIQKESSGIHYEINLLFIHAQDTLMSIKSELMLTKELIEILKVIGDKLQ